MADRAYAATYLESIIMSRMMLRLVDTSAGQDRPQIQRAVEDAQARYRSALLRMANVRSAINDNVTIFGYAPDYIPFPALDTADFRQSNAFEVFLLRARNKVQFAREREELALSSNREFETDVAQFQAELTQIRNNYEGQLADLCGTFEANGRIYPAIGKYSHLDDRATLLGEPCGLLGNGQIHTAMASFDELLIESNALQVSYQNVLEEVEIERQRVSAQCDQIVDTADFVYMTQGTVNNMRRDINNSQFAINRLQAVNQTVQSIASLAVCDPTTCAQAVAAGFIIGASALVTETAVGLLEADINAKEFDISELERTQAYWQSLSECDMAQIESSARVKTTLLRLKELDLEALRLEHRAKLALSELKRLRHQAQRLENEQAETEQLTINVQAAHNNPNVRIYRNDAIINADIAFEQAIREVYKATRVFEYYTSQSYAHKNDLFLIRMVSRGDINLENYLNELENTFYEFEELFGAPASRVHIVSLKNDVFAVPRTDEGGAAIPESVRIERMRQRLTDRTLLDRNGYISIPFSTDLKSVSPLTRNHKILHVEADLFGNDTGDYLGRVYLRQKGTGVIHALSDERQYYRFDERTAVINTIFSGNRLSHLDGSIYQSGRLRDRPFVNTNWELVINQRDEEVNQDINLFSLDDIRIYIYYTDFTAF